MKKLITFLAPLFLSLSGIIPVTVSGLAQDPFTKGVNLTGWFQTSGIKQVQFTRYTKEDFINIKSLGCDVIRLPIDLTAMTNGSPDYTVDPLFYFMLDSAVKWAEDLHINLILDNHTMDPGANTDPAIGSMLQKIWIQVAGHYKDHSDYIYYELRNEPHGISTSAWAQIEKNLITSIREIDTKHAIVVGASGWNTYGEMSQLPVFTDTNLVYTFHFYDPFLFTHQGATWPSPSMGSLAGVPFPYDAAGMPDCPADLKGTWIEGSLNTSYKNDGTVAKVKQLIDQAVSFKNSRNVRVFCGEFGVYDLNSDTADRVFWYETVRNYLELKGISWTIWDYHGGFGIFRKGTPGLFESDLNIPMVEALGLTPPEQTGYVQKIDSSAFFIYNDVIQEKIRESSSPGSGTLDFYSTDDAYSGKYCIELANPGIYNNMGLDFVPDRDFSFLKTDKYFLEFWAKGNSSSIKFDIRFIDTKSGPDDHPWRMRRTIDKSLIPFDYQWHYVKLPLTTFTEHGSWDNEWFNPVGAFDWKAIDRLEFVAEYFALTGDSLWFDQIAISKISQITGTGDLSEPTGKTMAFVWPNPINDESILSYSLKNDGIVDISIYNLSGQKISSIISRYQQKGDYRVALNLNVRTGNVLPAGMYFCCLKSCGNYQTIKLLVGNHR